jgi:hypothetical protein
MDGSPFEPIPSLERKLDRLRRGVSAQVTVRPTSARWAWVEYMLAQTGEDAGLAALDAWRAGSGFAAWKRAFRERDAQPFLAQRVLDGRRQVPTLAQWPVTRGP